MNDLPNVGTDVRPSLLQPGPTVHVRPRSVAIVGSGHWGRNLVRNFHSLGALGAVCDSDPVALAEVGRHCPEAALHRKFADVLSAPGIDAVVIATPAIHHGEMTRRALLAGKDVLVEKPMCLSVAEGERLVEIAESNDRILMVGHLLWYHPAVLRLHRLVQDGVLGTMHYIYSSRVNIGRIRTEENVLWSFAPHDVSVILGLMDEVPEWATASAGFHLDQRTADTTVSVLGFRSGRQAHVFVSWLHPFKEQKLVVVGDRGMAVFDDTLPWSDKLALYSHAIQCDDAVPVVNKAEAERVELDPVEPLNEECRHFLDCLRSRRGPRTDGHEALNVLRALLACEQSVESNARVRLAAEETMASRRFDAHENAVVDEGAQIGDGCRIWHFSHVMSGARIGAGCNIGQNVVIHSGAVVGNGCKIQNNVSVFDGVEVEDSVFLGPGMMFTNIPAPRAHIVRRHRPVRTLVREGASVGANATILCGTTIGRYALVGAGSVVIRNVPDYGRVAGNPARLMGWSCRCGDRLGDALACPSCGESYYRTENGIAPW